MFYFNNTARPNRQDTDRKIMTFVDSYQRDYILIMEQFKPSRSSELAEENRPD